MSLSETLARAQRDVDAGDLGKARDRLEGLLRAYPEDLEIRRRLGEVYWRLQYPERAGLNWYLLPSDGPEMDAAKESFRRRYGGIALLMLQALRYRGGVEPIRGTHAETALRELARRAHLRETEFVASISRPEPGRQRQAVEPWWGRLLVWSILAILIAILVLAVVGFVSLIGRL